MAQTRERAPAKAATGASTSEKAGTSGTEAPKSGFSLARLLAPRPPQSQTGANGQPARPRSQMSKLLFGLLLLMLASQVFEIVLLYADANLHLNLQHYIAGTNGGTKPGTAFLFGGMTWFALIYFGAIIALYFVLLRFNILPKDPFGTRAAASRSAQGGGSSSNSTTARTTSRSNNPPPLPSGINPAADRSRAARREAQRRAAAVAPPPQKPSLLGRLKAPAALTAVIGKAASSGAKTTSSAGSSTAKTASAPAAKSTSNVTAKSASSASAKSTTASARKATGGSSSSAAPSGDAMYERVRAEQRLRKRRAAKR